MWQRNAAVDRSPQKGEALGDTPPASPPSSAGSGVHGLASYAESRTRLAGHLRKRPWSNGFVAQT